MKAWHNPGNTTWFCIRRNGRSRREGWVDISSLIDLRHLVGARPDEAVEVCLAENFRHVTPNRIKHVFFPRARGIVGMEIGFRGEITRLAPTRMIASNLGFDRVLERFLEERDVLSNDFIKEGCILSFTTRQYLLPSGEMRDPVELYRGSTIVDPESSSDETRATELAEGIGQWMLSNLSPDGALPYKYWPSRGEKSPADNAIRRFLASLALARLGALRNSSQINKAARQNLRYNLRQYFKEIGGGCGAIVEKSGAKLGAAAIAGLAILESPARKSFPES